MDDLVVEVPMPTTGQAGRPGWSIVATLPADTFVIRITPDHGKLLSARDNKSDARLYPLKFGSRGPSTTTFARNGISIVVS